MAMKNPELTQTRIEEPSELYRKYCYGMFPQQRTIYKNLARLVKGKTVLEAGCGNGMSTAMLEREAFRIIGTDKLSDNVIFAAELYPWISFRTWDFTKLWGHTQSQVVVCIEALEHVAAPMEAVLNLIAASSKELWISTPNGTDKPRPPENPYHVQEYTPEELLSFVPKRYQTQFFDWKTFDQGVSDPLVLRISKC